MNLERITNVLVAFAALAVLGRVGMSFYSASPSQRPAAVYAKGFKIGDTADLGLRLAPRSLILFTRSGCSYCTRSMRFTRG